LVYPQPLACPRPQAGGDGALDGHREQRMGSEDFYAFRSYRPCDNPRHVLWRARAKGLPLQTKQFSEEQMLTEWLDWESLQGDRETRLGNLCYWVLELHRQSIVFGLRLPDVVIELGSGDEHRTRALQKLATFGLGPAAARTQRGWNRG
jgi:uncharacterized protein (DUF58 family)